jgi:hypothetical protein
MRPDTLCRNGEAKWPGKCWRRSDRKLLEGHLMTFAVSLAMLEEMEQNIVLKIKLFL